MNSSAWNRARNKAFKYFGICCTMMGLVLLAIFIVDILIDGLPRLNWQFVTSLPSRLPHKAGILPAMIGTMWILGLTAILAIPVGVATAIYLEEYGRKNTLASMIEINIANLAGVPSIIYGLLGLELFGRLLGLGGSLMTGALTLSLLILPIIIVATRESLKAVPKTIREASYALGATRWQTIRHQVLPAAAGGIFTGVILSLSRAVGETAPLIVIGALAYVPFVPTSPADEFSVLPIQIFNWVSRPQKGFLVNAAAAIIVLLLITLLLNAVAVWLRHRTQRRLNW